MRKTVFLTVILILAFCVQAYTQTCSPAQTGLVSWWSGDNNSLDSRSRNNGTLQNGATYASGKVGQGFSFDGVDDRVFVPHNANLNVANVTLEAWVFPTAFGGQGSIINKRTAINNAGYGLEPTAGGNLSFFLYIGGTSFFVTSTNQLTLNTWSHVAGTFDGNTLKVFINGVQDGSTSASGSIDPTTGDLVIGENIVNGTHWNGKIDEPTVYNRALSASEIQAIVNAGTAGKCKPSATVSPSGLVGFWTGDGNANDSTGTSNGTIQGNVTYSIGKTSQGFQLGGNGDLSGNGDRVNVGNPTNLQLQDFTIETWIKRSSSTIVTNSPFPGVAGGTFFAYGQNGYGFLIDQATNRLALTNVGNSAVFSNLTVTDTNWHHVAVTKLGNQTVFYVDGVSDTQSYSTTFGFTTNAAIGARGDSNVLNTFFGAIDELSIYNRDLTTSEIQSIYNAGIAGKLKESSTINTNNLVSLWRGEGNANDFTANNNGTLTNGATFATGKFGQAFSFDGVNDSVQIGDSASLDVTNNFTLQAWINPASLQSDPTNGGIISKVGGGGGNNGYQFGMTSNNTQLYCQFNAPTEAWATNKLIVTLGSAIPVGAWTHVACTYNNANLTIYVNGVSVGTTVIGSKSVINSTSSLRISGDDNGVVYFHGLIDEPSVYSRALSPAEIQAVYNSGNGVSSVMRDATVTFPNITTAGITQQIPLDQYSLPTLPFASVGLTYDIATSAIYSGSPQVCFNLPAITNSTTFSNLRIYHLESNVWANRTDLSSINFATKTICTLGLTSLSPFAIVNAAAPTAANASVSGKITTEKGRGMARVGVILQNVNTGEIKQVLTNNFGRFRFDELESGDFYILSVNKKGYQFNPNQQGFQLNENLADLNIIGVPFN